MERLLERFKFLAEQWRAEAEQSHKLSQASGNPVERTCRYGMALQQDFCAEELDLAILATENEAFMESIVPGFKDLDDVVATDAANSVIL